MRLKLTSIFGLLLFTQIVFGQTTVQRMDSLFNNLHNNQLFNGNVLVAEKGKIIYQKSFGYSDYATKKPNTKDTRFHLASVTKTITAVAILQLKDKGKLKLDEKVKFYLTDFPYDNITIRHLLTHTSGIPDANIFRAKRRENPDYFFHNKDIIPALIAWKEPLSTKPGDERDYSNIGFSLLAVLIEKLSGLNYPDYLQKNIFGPAKMTDSYVSENDLYRRKDALRATNHWYSKFYSNVLVDALTTDDYSANLLSISGLVGSTRVISTTEDLLKYDQCLHNGKLLKSETLTEAFTPTMLNNGKPALYSMADIGRTIDGIGWPIMQDTSQGKIVWQTGAYIGASSILLRNITKQQTIIAFDNTHNNAARPAGMNAFYILNNLPVKPITKSLGQEYVRTLVTKGEHAAFCRYIELQNDSLHYSKKRFEEEVNDCVFLELINDSSVVNNIEKSVDAFRLLVLLYPKSWNTYDSYAYALEKKGMYKEAILMYKKSLELNPKNDNANVEIEKIKVKLK